jgi:hypothetical protein
MPHHHISRYSTGTHHRSYIQRERVQQLCGAGTLRARVLQIWCGKCSTSCNECTSGQVGDKP